MISRQTFQENPQGEDLVHSALPSPCIGRIALSGKPGEIRVEVNGSGARVARLLATVSRYELMKPESEGREVLLVFEQGDPDRPIIVGMMENQLEDLILSPPIQGESLGGDGPKDAKIDGKRVILEAKEEIVLKCGSGSIVLRKDGKIIIKGTHLLSRSSGPIRVKGGSVNIN